MLPWNGLGIPGERVRLAIGVVSPGTSTGGSVASYAPTGLQVQSGHDLLLDGFYAGVFDDGDRILGQAVYKAKLNLDSGFSGYQDLHDTFMLLGDPAMGMAMPDLVKSFMPLTSR